MPTAHPAKSPFASDAFLAAIVNSSADAIVTKDLNGVITSWNAGAQRIFGYTAAEAIGQPVTLLFPIGRLNEESTILARIQRGEVIDHYETVRRRKDGTLIDISLTVSPIRDDRGTIIGASKIARDITQQKHVQERFRVTLGSIGDAVISTDEQGRIVFMNDIAEQLTGWTEKAAVGEPLAEVFRIVNETTRRPVDSPAALVMQHGTTVGLANHTLLISRDGREVPIDDSAAPIRNTAGNLIGVVLVFRDVREKRQAENNANRLAAIIEGSDDAIVGKDLKGVVTNWNPAAERIFGYTAAEMIGQPISLIIPPDRQNEQPAIMERIRQGERIEHFETVRRRKDGGLVSISLTISPLLDHAGHVVGASKISRDITAKKRGEAQQHALYELAAAVNRAAALDEIYEAALDGMMRCQQADRAAILLCDPDRVVRFKASRGLSPAYRAAVEGHTPWESDDPNPQPLWIDDVARATLAPELRAAVESEDIQALAFIPLTYEQRLLGKFMIYYNAPHHFTLAELRPVEAIASQVAFAIERRKSAAALEALVDERTASLRQAVAQMEEFSYSVSHDLRAPVRAMCGFAEAILEDHACKLGEDGRQLLARIIRNGARMDRLIQDLLTYSRISRREIRLEPVSLEKLVHEVVQQYPDMRPDRADIEVASPLPEVMAHEPSLTQAVSNLLSNAVKFVPPHARPRVRVGCERRRSQVRLWVEDNGIGIKPEYHPRLFAMFERLHPEKNYEGTGIGLAIVRKAVERMNGTVGVESDGVSGSKFWIELPIAAGANGVAHDN